jgi:hypothetical protein
MEIRSAVLVSLHANWQTEGHDKAIMQGAFSLRLSRKQTAAWVA